MTVHLFPTHPRLSQPLPFFPRGWWVLGGALVSWFALMWLVYGLMAIAQVLS